MDEIFSGLDFVKVYLDDIIIHSNNLESHEIHENNVKININKSEFFKEKIHFLGHVISAAGIGIYEPLVKNFQLKKPKNKRGIQRLLGFLNYFRLFIRQFSQKTLFLTDILWSKDKIQWNAEHTEKFMDILKELTKSPVLTYPDPEQDFILETDASGRAIGAVLKQKDRIVSFYSHKFSPQEERYTSMEKEALGILKSLEYFKLYVIGSRVIIYTDNQNLLFNKDLTKRVQRWKLLLEEYNYELRGIEGKNNKIADTISRIRTLNSNSEYNYWLSNENLQILGESNSKINTRILTENPNFAFDHKNRLIIPERNKYQIIKKLHHDLSHPGSKKLYMTIARFVTSKNLKRDIEFITATCHECQVNKESRHKIGLHTGYIYSAVPFEFISSDIFGPIKTEHFHTSIKNEFFYILTFTDICTRFTRLFLLKNIKTDSVINKLRRWLERYPKPVKFLSDM
ncbi:Transposon Tf2-6 polyprotein [Dictyocoela roeselum]|nr:Transposon Tf2-6 polyprotein [Dictyocoela roeselum]